MNILSGLDQFSRNDIDEALFNALRAVHRFETAKVTVFGLNYEAIYLLQFLRRRSPARMTAIAEEMRIPVSTATRVVDRLEKRGFLSRKKAFGDKRIILVSLKPKGENIVREVEDHTFRIISDNLESIDPKKIEAFIETALNMAQILKVDTD